MGILESTVGRAGMSFDDPDTDWFDDAIEAEAAFDYEEFENLRLNS